MTIEEKAKAYDEAIKYAHYLINKRCKEGTDGSFHRTDLHKMFPKLKESEDEKIRKELLKAFSCGHDNSDIYGHGITYGQVRAWLEKQAEQKPAPDWMLKFLDELRSKRNYFDWDEHKDIEGGILAVIKWMNPNYFNKKDGEQKSEEVDNLHNYLYGEQKPANSTMQEKAEIDSAFTQMMEKEQKPAWSEEDETRLNDAIDACKVQYGNMSYTADWLLSIKDRVQPQPKQEWSEEDEEQLKYAIAAIQWYAGDADIIAWIKSLKYRVQPNPALGEEDRRMLIGLIDELDAIMNKATPNEISVYSKYTNWLKSLRPQSTWKPSDEQMEALRVAYEVGTANESWAMDKLKGLYQELKKLME